MWHDKSCIHIQGYRPSPSPSPCIAGATRRQAPTLLHNGRKERLIGSLYIIWWGGVAAPPRNPLHSGGLRPGTSLTGTSRPEVWPSGLFARMAKGVALMFVRPCIAKGVALMYVRPCVAKGVALMYVRPCVAKGVALMFVHPCVAKGTALMFVLPCVAKGVAFMFVRSHVAEKDPADMCPRAPDSLKSRSRFWGDKKAPAGMCPRTPELLKSISPLFGDAGMCHCTPKPLISRSLFWDDEKAPAGMCPTPQSC